MACSFAKPGAILSQDRDPDAEATDHREKQMIIIE